jgi:hypothetical protein
MDAPAGPRPHRRAARQLLLGLVPLLVVGLALVVVLAVRFAEARAPLDAATASGVATVQATGRAPDGRGVTVGLDAGGQPRRGVLVLAAASDAAGIPRGTRLGVTYDPSDPPRATAVFIDGDAAHKHVQDVLFGLVVVAAVLLVTTALTALRFVSRPRLRRATPVGVTASRVVVRQGLLVRSWLELVTPGGLRWLPVHWSPELATLAPGTAIEVRGDPVRGRLVLPVVDGAEIWPSGRLRRSAPRGGREVADPMPETTGTGWARQVRVDAVLLAVAPVLGLLWAYVDGSGVGGFVVATLVVAAVLFWLPQLLGSDPAPPDRE